MRFVHVTKEFDLTAGKLRAVWDMNLSIARGECVAIVGESGCGKSTFARMAAGIEPVSDGEILYQGKKIADFHRNELREFRRRVQMIFQEPGSVFSPKMRIGAFLMEPWINFEKKSRREAREMALYGLERVGLSGEYFSRYPHQLSGGELQRIAIARAIALHPNLLICDEATSALDVSVQREVIDLLKEHQREADFAVLFICHDLALAEDFGNRVVVMYLGCVMEILEGKELKRNAEHPYTRALLDSVFSIHDDPGNEIYVLPGEPPSPVNLPEGCLFCARCGRAGDICRREAPKLRCRGGEHWVACHMLE